MSVIPTAFANANQPLYVPYYSAGGGTSNIIAVSSISTQYLTVWSGDINLFGNTLISTIGGNALGYWNGTQLEPIATQSNLSSIADWAYDPAITNVDMAGNDIENANVIDAG